MTEPHPIPGSFRDPSGFVFERGGTLYRQVNRSFADRYDRVVGSGLYEVLRRQGLLEGTWCAQGLLIPHREAEVEAAVPDLAHRVLAPERVRFVAYPYEWPFGLLRGAAMATLRSQRIALDHGMTLRDASAYNVQLHEGRPVLIDSLSFEPWEEGRPWVAYAQFCQHFLAPLALMARCDVRLGGLLRVHLDGVPLDLAASLLPRRARLKPSLWLHLVAHARAQQRHAEVAGPPGPSASPPRSRRFDLRAFRGLVDSLERAVEGLRWDPPRSVWSGYYGDCHTYSEEARAAKDRSVGSFLDEARPGTVWDLGANTGRFSRLAAGRGALTVSMDSNHGVVEASYRQVRRDGETGLVPLVIDVANPSPALGWAHEERTSLADRGPADLVMALALIHHLAIGNNVPLDRLAEFLGRLGEALIVEFVPKEDPQVRSMLATREDVFAGYTPEGFERAFGRRFTVARREPLPGSSRVLYLMRRRP